MSIKDDIKDQAKELDLPKLIDVDDWINAPPPTFDPIIEGVFDVGDKFAIIASSKMRKTFFNLQLLICIAAGINFLGFVIKKARRVVLVQYEIQETHFMARVQRICRALGIKNIFHNFCVINARGMSLEGPEGIKKIQTIVKDFKPELIVFDPLYKVSTGAENAAEDMKAVMTAFDGLAVTNKAGVGYVHHDAKGIVGDRDVRDRGAGSNVIGRDYDAALILSPQEDEENAVMVEVLVRNYKPFKPFVALWRDNFEHDGYCFELAVDIEPKTRKSTDKARKEKDYADLETFMPAALKILAKGTMDTVVFRDKFKSKTKLSDRRIEAFIRDAKTTKPTSLQVEETYGNKKHESKISIVKDPDFISE